MSLSDSERYKAEASGASEGPAVTDMPAVVLKSSGSDGLKSSKSDNTRQTLSRGLSEAVKSQDSLEQLDKEGALREGTRKTVRPRRYSRRESVQQLLLCCDCANAAKADPLLLASLRGQRRRSSVTPSPFVVVHCRLCGFNITDEKRGTLNLPRKKKKKFQLDDVSDGSGEFGDETRNLLAMWNPKQELEHAEQATKQEDQRRGHQNIQTVQLKPTYRMTPFPDKKFNVSAAKKTIEEAFGVYLNPLTKYDPVVCRRLTLKLCEAIKSRVRTQEGLSRRFKLVVFVTIGQDNRQGLKLASRGLVDPMTDTFVEAMFTGGKGTDKFFAVALVFAVYHE